MLEGWAGSCRQVTSHGCLVVACAEARGIQALPFRVSRMAARGRCP